MLSYGISRMLPEEYTTSSRTLGVATGGMQAKLEAAMSALERGVGEVVIAPGARTEVIEHALAGECVGTRMIP